MVTGILCGAALLGGCAGPQSDTPNSGAGKAIVTADFRPTGKVDMVDAPGRFVVISFEPGAVPKPGQRLNVYRAGAKIGEVKVTGPERDNNTVADILAGDVQPGDEAKED